MEAREFWTVGLPAVSSISGAAALFVGPNAFGAALLLLPVILMGAWVRYIDHGFMWK